MANKYQSVNKKLQESTHEFQQAMESILPQQQPLAGPAFSRVAFQPQDVLKSEKSLQNPEEGFSRTIKNNKTLAHYLGGFIEDNKVPLEKTSKNFYTPQKQKIGQKNSGILEPLSKSQIKGTKYSRSLIYSEQPIIHRSSVELNQNPTGGFIAGKDHKTISDLDPSEVLKYAKRKPKLGIHSTPQQIFDYFYELAPYFQKPLIKKFKNCLFFGDGPRNNASTRYTGFLYFFNEKIYYGNFQNDQKHGKGVEINIIRQIMFIGTFDKGHKIGQFTVKSPDGEYQGHLLGGKYHGRGKLVTNLSTYEGNFHNGCRHGYGEQIFIQSGLKLTGNFNMDKFSNTDLNINSANSNKKLPKKGIDKPKFANIFQFSFHDSSDSQVYETPRVRRTLRRNPNKQGLKPSRILESAQQDTPLPSYFQKIFK